MVRLACHSDIPHLLALGEAMHGESRYAALSWDARKVHALIAQLIESPDGLVLVADLQDGEPCGGLLACVDEHFATSARVAYDFAVFVTPGRRGSVLGRCLLDTYVEWARSRGADLIQVGITTGVHVEAATRLYESAGFLPVGPLFEHRGATHA